MEAARDSQTQALMLFQESNNENGQATCLENLGLLAIRDGRHEDAEKHYYEALWLHQR